MAYGACRNLVHGDFIATQSGAPLLFYCLLIQRCAFSIGMSLVDFVCEPFRLNVDFGILVEDSFIWLDNKVPGDRWLHFHNGQRHE